MPPDSATKGMVQIVCQEPVGPPSTKRFVEQLSSSDHRPRVSQTPSCGGHERCMHSRAPLDDAYGKVGHIPTDANKTMSILQAFRLHERDRRGSFGVYLPEVSKKMELHCLTDSPYLEGSADFNKGPGRISGRSKTTIQKPHDPLPGKQHRSKPNREDRRQTSKLRSALGARLYRNAVANHEDA